MSRYAAAKRGYKKKQQVKSRAGPKRALSAYFWFCKDERSKVQSSIPRADICSVSKELGRRWARAPANLKRKYESKAAKDKARYQKAMSRFKPRGGKPSNGKKGRRSPCHEEEVEEDDDDDDDDEDN